MAMFGMTAGSLYLLSADPFPDTDWFENLVWISSGFRNIGRRVGGGRDHDGAHRFLAKYRASHDGGAVGQAGIHSGDPYVFAGMAIALALTRSPWPVPLVYGVDLVGAATGCLVILPS